MKRGWKIALGVLGLVVVIGSGGMGWMLTQAPKPAKMVAPGPNGKRIAAEGMLANYFPAGGKGPHPAILLLGGSEGGLAEGLRAQALLLQAAGFSTLHLAYHNAPGKSAKLVNIPLEEFYRALDWLKRQSGVDARRIAIVGYSKGAEAGLLVATRYPGIRATVLGMPSSVVWDGMSGENYLLGSFSSSWSEKGEPIAHLAYKGQLMLICGEAEKLWPSCPMTDQIVERARLKGAPQPIVLRYKDAGHGVAGAPRSNRDQDKWPGKLGGTEEGNWAARADSWPKIVNFLRTELGVVAK